MLRALILATLLIVTALPVTARWRTTPRPVTDNAACTTAYQRMVSKIMFRISRRDGLRGNVQEYINAYVTSARKYHCDQSTKGWWFVRNYERYCLRKISGGAYHDCVCTQMIGATGQRISGCSYK